MKVKLDSSNPQAVEFFPGDSPLSGRLRVWFKQDRVYDYFGVSLARYRELIASPEQGKFFYSKIRSRYRFVEVTGREQG